MGTSASENIAIAVTTSAELSGTRAARSDLGALGQESAKVTQQLDKTNAAAAAVGASTTTAAAGTNKLTVSAAQMNAALQASGGDLQKAAQLAAAQATAATTASTAVQQQAAATTAAATATVTAQATVAAATNVASEASANLTAATNATTAAQATAVAKAPALAKAQATVAQQTNATATAVGKIPPQARTATNALGILAQAAVSGQGSIAGMATAVGNLSVGLATVATNAKIAAGATALGLIVQLGALAYGIFDGFQKKTKELNNELADLASKGRGLDDALAGKDLAQRLEQINRAADKEIEHAKEIKFHGAERAKIIAQINANREKEIALANEQADNERAARSAERNAQISLGSYQEQIEKDRAEGKKTEIQLQLQANEAQRLQRAVEIDQQFRRRSSSGEIIQLNREEIVQRDELLRQNDAISHSLGEQLRIEQQIVLQSNTARRLQGSDKLTDRIQGRLEEIELERRAEIQRTGDVYNATLDAEQKKRLLYRETARQANENAKTIFDILRSTNDKTLKAVGTFGENLRRVVVGAEAARALVRAATEGAEAIASLAIGDFRGAALHGAAAVQFGAAAALGARESLGGGGSGGGGGGGGGAASAVGSTYATKERSEGSPVIVNLFTTDPYNRENIQIASYQLQRARITNRPIYVPPTNGFDPRGN
jgi:hypothetical protein